MLNIIGKNRIFILSDFNVYDDIRTLPNKLPQFTSNINWIDSFQILSVIMTRFN